MFFLNYTINFKFFIGKNEMPLPVRAVAFQKYEKEKYCIK